MKHFLLVSFSFIFIINLNGQRNPVRASTTYDDMKKEWVISVENDLPGRTVIEVTFKEASNMSCKDGTHMFKKTVGKGQSRLTTYTKLDPSRSINVKYSYRYFMGCHNARPKFEYPYAIPLNPGKETSIRKMHYIGEKYANTSAPKDWYSITFKTEKGDTIRAARRGRVVKVVNNFEGLSTNKLSFKNEVNHIIVQHKDCTMARYALFEKDGIFVTIGQDVETGDPLGTIDGSDFNLGSHLRFSVYYYDKSEKSNPNDPKDKWFYYAYVYTQFLVDGATRKIEVNEPLQAVITDELIMNEMTKRQKKKWLKTN